MAVVANIAQTQSLQLSACGSCQLAGQDHLGRACQKAAMERASLAARTEEREELIVNLTL